mgnify:CR=1 FL=1
MSRYPVVQLDAFLPEVVERAVVLDHVVGTATELVLRELVSHPVPDSLFGRFIALYDTRDSVRIRCKDHGDGVEVFVAPGLVNQRGLVDKQFHAVRLGLLGSLREGFVHAWMNDRVDLLDVFR